MQFFLGLQITHSEEFEDFILFVYVYLWTVYVSNQEYFKIGKFIENSNSETLQNYTEI